MQSMTPDVVSKRDRHLFEVDGDGRATSLRYYPNGRRKAEVHAARRVGK
jgi:YD repeat-containing protein